LQIFSPKVTLIRDQIWINVGACGPERIIPVLKYLEVKFKIIQSKIDYSVKQRTCFFVLDKRNTGWFKVMF